MITGKKYRQPKDNVKHGILRPVPSILNSACCGSGAFTTFVARAVGPEGIVYALDIQPAMLEQLKRKLARQENADIRNVMPVEASAYDMPLQDGSVDLAYTITVLQEIPDKAKALAEIKRVLKPGGLVAVTEFLPDPDYPLKSTVARQLTDAGFRLEGVYGGIWQYTVRAVKA
jgi:ubiquinone/menaquinone biosynthesis C-methylase UbiE